MSSSRVRFAMKYSSTTSFGLSGDRLSMSVLALVCGAGRQRGAARLFDRAQDFDAAQHNAFVDLVSVERDADRAQQHDGQPAAEVLPELVQPAQNRRVIT